METHRGDREAETGTERQRQRQRDRGETERQREERGGASLAALPEVRSALRQGAVDVEEDAREKPLLLKEDDDEEDEEEEEEVPLEVKLRMKNLGRCGRCCRGDRSRSPRRT
jgi:hypothetical protein